MTKTPPIGTLMLIDDDDLDQMLCERLIKRSGLVGTYIGFACAEAALAHLRTQPLPAADAILLDVNMPRMDGFEFLEAATAELGNGFARTVVILLTTALAAPDQARLKQVPLVTDYCRKPLELDFLHRLATRLQNDE